MEDSISFANSYENFLKLMELKGYELKQKNGETFLKPMGEKRFIRLTDISGNYTKEALECKIENGIMHEINKGENRTPRIIRCRKNYRRYIPPTSYQKAFLAKMYRTGQLKRKPYSQMWRYKEDVEKFEKLQSQYLYLCRNSIHSAEELEKRKKNLDTRMDALDEQRHQIYKSRYPYKSVLALLKIIEENEIRASYYKEGSTFYAPNYGRWKEATEILIQKGYTINQIIEIKETFQRELASVTKAKRELKKEEILINDILFEKSRVQMVEKLIPALEAKENTKEILRKGDDAEKTETVATEITAKTDTAHLQDQPAHNDKQKQSEQAR